MGGVVCEGRTDVGDCEGHAETPSVTGPFPEVALGGGHVDQDPLEAFLAELEGVNPACVLEGMRKVEKES